MKPQFTLVATALCFTSLANASSCLNYGDKPVTLNGKVELQSVFGPPGYGDDPDTDALETQGVLLVEPAICVAAGSKGEPAETSQSEITIVPPKDVDLKAYAGKAATVQGTLFHASDKSHHTQVLMQVQSISKR